MARYVSCSQCPKKIRRADSKTGLCRECYRKMQSPDTLSNSVDTDRLKKKTRDELSELKDKYRDALDQIARLEAHSTIWAELQKGVDTTYRIRPHQGSGTSEAVPVVLASDWHSEEIVTPAQVNGLNEFNLDIADRRIQRFWQASVNLIKNHLNPGVAIHNVVIALLGDFITNHIHDELVENVALGPTKALLWVMNRMVAGLDYCLNSTPYTFTIVCKVGNHSRTTKKTHFSKENEHSLEHLLYMFLVDHYRGESRVKFVITDGYLTYLDVFDSTLRFHHGHAVNYGGGVGGITIPVNKAIAEWDKGRQATLDCFGHFHQTIGNRKFKCNGSLIGYNAFAVRIKAGYEPPQQTLFLVDKKRGVTADWPILVGDTKSR